MARFSELKDIERPGSLQALVCGLVLVNVVGIACVLPITSWSGVQRIVIVLLIVGPLFAAFRATQRQTVVIASYAMFWALVIGITHGWGTTTGQLLSNEHLARLLVVAIGDVFSIALARLRERSERTNAQLTAILDSVPLGLGFLSNEFRFVRVNDTYAQLSGHEQAEYFGQLSRELFPQLGQETLAKLDELMFQALSGSSLVADDFSEFGDRSGEGQTWRVSFFPVKDKLGQKLGLGSIVEDVSERARRTRAQRRTQARAHFLAQASVELTRSVDYVETLPRICQLITDHQLADICLIDIIDGAYLNRQAAVDRTGTLSNRDLSRRLDVPSHLIEAMTLGTPILCNPLDPETAADILLTESPGERGRSALLIPLITSGRTLGVMSWLATSQERQFGEDDRMFAEEVGSHVAALIEQARLYRESTRLAQALQENLLPPSLPPVPGLELAARYHAVGEGNEIGGDFYDVFPIGDDRWAILVGDVEGKGAQATSLVAMAHYTLRTVALQEHSPAAMLARLNEEILRQRDESPFCSVALVIVNPRNDGLDITAASGGHPYPLIKRADGHVEALASSGMLVGISPLFDIDETTTHLDRGDSMVLYTDGVSDVRSNGHMLGQGGISDLIASCQDRDPQALADWIDTTIAHYQHDLATDDVALIVVSVPYKDPVYRSQRFPADPQSVREVRLMLQQAGDERPDIPCYDIQLMASELAANAVLYGRYDLIGEIAIEASIAVSETRVRCEITNRGEPFAQEATDPGVEALGGRGLMIVDSLASRWGKEASSEGKTKVWFEIDLDNQPDLAAPVDPADPLAAFADLEAAAGW